MTRPKDEIALVRLLRNENDKLTQENEALKGGGGGGTFDGMESRVNRIESRLDTVGDRVGKVETTLATLTERVSHLPSKDFIVKTVVGTGAVLAAVSVFGEKIQNLLGI